MENPRSFPILKIVVSAYKITFGNPRELLRLIWLPILISFGGFSISLLLQYLLPHGEFYRKYLGLYDAEFYTYSYGNFSRPASLVFVGFLIFIERWHRFVLSSPQKAMPRSTGTAVVAYLKVLAVYLAAGVLLLLASWPMVVTGTIAHLAPGRDTSIGSFILFCFAFILFAWVATLIFRISLVIPIISERNAVAFREAWQLARKHGFSILFTYLLAVLPLIVLFFPLETKLSPQILLILPLTRLTFGSTMLTFATYLLKYSGLAVGAAALSLTYKTLVERQGQRTETI